MTPVVLREEILDEAEAVAASTSMEGVPVTVDEVRRILAGDRPPDVKGEDAALVRGYRDAMSFVLLRADASAVGGGRAATWVGAGLFVVFLYVFALVSGDGVDRQNRRIEEVSGR